MKKVFSLALIGFSLFSLSSFSQKKEPVVLTQTGRFISMAHNTVTGEIKVNCSPDPKSVCYKIIAGGRQMDSNEVIIEVFQNGLKINEFFTTDFKKNINSIEFKVED